MLHFAAYSGDYTLQRIFSSKPTGVTQERANTGLFSAICTIFSAPPPTILASIFYHDKGSAVPSLVDHEVEFRQLTKLFSFYRFRPSSNESEKKTKINTSAEIRTRELADGRLRGYQLDHRGRRFLFITAASKIAGRSHEVAT